MKEAQLIELFHGAASVALDDCAPVLPAELIATDALVEDVHFRRDWSSPEDIAIKLVQCNASDMNASGAAPAWCLLNLGLPPVLSGSFAERFAQALLAELQTISCKLIGGDTFRAPKLFLSLTMAGRAKRIVLRSGAKPGDRLWLSAPLGWSLAGYRNLSGELQLPPEIATAARRKHLQPRADLRLGPRLAALAATHAMMDISDGLLSDAPRMAEASGVQLRIQLNALPLPAPLAAFAGPELALLSGEELALLAAGGDELRSEGLIEIGTVSARQAGDQALALFDSEGCEAPLPAASFQHF